MSGAGIVLDTHFIAQAEDSQRWEERFDLLLEELRAEYGEFFFWSNDATGEVDIQFILYPPSQHQRMVDERVLEHHVNSICGRVSVVHIIVCGRNLKEAKVSSSAVLQIVNDQCIPSGVKADSFRALRPEDIDASVRQLLVRLRTRKLGSVAPSPPEALGVSNEDVSESRYSMRPIYESGDL